MSEVPQTLQRLYPSLNLHQTLLDDANAILGAQQVSGLKIQPIDYTDIYTGIDYIREYSIVNSGVGFGMDNEEDILWSALSNVYAKNGYVWDYYHFVHQAELTKVTGTGLTPQSFEKYCSVNSLTPYTHTPPTLSDKGSSRTRLMNIDRRSVELNYTSLWSSRKVLNAIRNSGLFEFKTIRTRWGTTTRAVIPKNIFTTNQMEQINYLSSVNRYRTRNSDRNHFLSGFGRYPTRDNMYYEYVYRTLFKTLRYIEWDHIPKYNNYTYNAIANLLQTLLNSYKDLGYTITVPSGLTMEYIQSMDLATLCHFIKDKLKDTQKRCKDTESIDLSTLCDAFSSSTRVTKRAKRG